MTFKQVNLYSGDLRLIRENFKSLVKFQSNRNQNYNIFCCWDNSNNYRQIAGIIERYIDNVFVYEIPSSFQRLTQNRKGLPEYLTSVYTQACAFDLMRTSFPSFLSQTEAQDIYVKNRTDIYHHSNLDNLNFDLDRITTSSVKYGIGMGDYLVLSNGVNLKKFLRLKETIDLLLSNNIILPPEIICMIHCDLNRLKIDVNPNLLRRLLAYQNVKLKFRTNLRNECSGIHYEYFDSPISSYGKHSGGISYFRRKLRFYLEDLFLDFFGKF